MKRVFLFISFLCLTIFTVFAIQNKSEGIKYMSYPRTSVTSKTTQHSLSKEEIDNRIQQLSLDNHSTVAKLIVEPNEVGKIAFKYGQYGQNKLPNNLTTASAESFKTSNLMTTYLVVDGNLKLDDLTNIFNESGYQASSIPARSTFTFFLNTVMTVISILFFLVSSLIFASLTFITNIKKLKAAGIKIISGLSFTKVSCQLWISDVKVIITLIGLSFIVGVPLLFLLNILSTVTLGILSYSLIIYGAILLLISFILSLFYYLTLKQSHLISLVKGKISVKKIMGVILFNQIIAFVFVGIISLGLIHYINSYQTQQSADKDWQQSPTYYHLTLSMSGNFMVDSDRQHNENNWYHFANDAISKDQALMIDFQRKGLGSESNIENSPYQNILYVTPNYLDRTNIKLDSSLKNRLLNLKKGDFGILIPAQFQNQKDDIIAQHTQIMQDNARETRDIRSPISFTVNPIIGYLEDDISHFLMNTSDIDLTQYQTNTVLVITNPEAMGNTEASNMFWKEKSANSLFYRDYHQTIERLQAYDIYNEVGYLENAFSLYLSRTNEERNQTIAFIVGGLFTITTAILLFTAMTLIYFEQFRKEIFIKRVAGLNFFQIHTKYLFIECLTLIIGAAITYGITANLRLSTTILLVIISILSIILTIQVNKEQKTAVSVIKGK